MKNWFADISMTRKLTIGFGAVLLLTIALAISGWLSLSGVIHRSELMERIAALNEALDELRVARLQYMLDNGDAKSAEAVTEALDHFAAQHRDIAPAFRDPQNRMLLQKQGEQIQRYRATLSRMREAYAAGNAARADMGKQAALASEPIAAMGKAVAQMPEHAENRYTGIEAIAELRMNWQLVRYEMRGYNTTPTPEMAAKVGQQIKLARQSAARVQTVLGQAYSAQVAVTEQALDGYLAALHAVVAQTEAISTARQDMASQAGEIRGLARALTQAQSASREHEAAQSKLTQALVTAFALLIGLLAAWLITRQITHPLAETLAVVRNIAAGDLTDQAFLTNAVFWRPPGNRPPTAEELAICAPFVARTLAILQPKAVLLIGATAAKAVLQTDESLMKLRGQWRDWQLPEGGISVPTLTTFHPAFLLRQPQAKRAVWADILSLMTHLNGNTVEATR